MRSSTTTTATTTSTKAVNPLLTIEHTTNLSGKYELMVFSTVTRQSLDAGFRDAYGFAVKPQHVQRYREYANIYKEEELERSDRWNDFLERQAERAGLHIKEMPLEEEKVSHIEVAEDGNNEAQKGDGDNLCQKKSGSDSLSEKRGHGTKIWTDIKPSLMSIEDMMSTCIKKKGMFSKEEQETGQAKSLSPVEDGRFTKGAPEEDSEDEFYDADAERSDPGQDAPTIDSTGTITDAAANAVPIESLHLWKEELEVLVRGGVPMDLRGEIWQAFVGVRSRRVENYYQDLVANETNTASNTDQESHQSDSKGSTTESTCGHEKWKLQIEKDLPRTFPGHPALDDDGRNALRRLLTAYARHNPSVGYCQAMNFFAALLLLLMPEENAFWTLKSIIDEYFDGCFSEEMIESQVDQLVFEELVRERFPKLVSHLDFLGVQVAWVTGPWFLSIFMNMLPWESVLRIWDVFLFEGNRDMIFRTALALIEFYGPALLTTKDAGDAVTLLQSLASSTFDSSQLVLTACMDYQNVNEQTLCELREKHRSVVKAEVDERLRGLQIWKKSQGLAKILSFKRDPNSLLTGNKTGQLVDSETSGNLSPSESESMNVDEVLSSLTGDAQLGLVPDVKQQVVGLKVELCKLLGEKKLAVIRSEALETALMEMVKQDTRRQLSARVEQLEQEVEELRTALSEKLEQEDAMLQVLMRMEQDQKETEDARMLAEQEAAGERYSIEVLQVKYKEAIDKVVEMEKRVVMAESMLEATKQYQSGQGKALPPTSPRSSQQNSPPSKNQELQQETPSRTINLLARPFVLNWRSKFKGKISGGGGQKSSSEDQKTQVQQKEDREA